MKKITGASYKIHLANKKTKVKTLRTSTYWDLQPEGRIFITSLLQWINTSLRWTPCSSIQMWNPESKVDTLSTNVVVEKNLDSHQHYLKNYRSAAKKVLGQRIVIAVYLYPKDRELPLHFLVSSYFKILTKSMEL